MATLAKSKPETSTDQAQRFERRLREVKEALANLPGDEYYAELLGIVRRVGWTTLAEGIFFDASIDSILAHTRDLNQLHQRLKAAFERVAKFTKPGVAEYEIEAEYAHEFIRRRSRFAYPPIIATAFKSS